jgi:ribosomal protein L24
VEGVQRVKKHTRWADAARRPHRWHRDHRAPIHVSNVMQVDPDDQRRVRVWATATETVERDGRQRTPCGCASPSAPVRTSDDFSTDEKVMPRLKAR